MKWAARARMIFTTCCSGFRGLLLREWVRLNVSWMLFPEPCMLHEAAAPGVPTWRCPVAIELTGDTKNK